MENELVIARLSNNQVQVSVFHAVYDCDKRQLVACGMASTSKQSIQSITASLVGNKKSYLTLRAPYPHPDGYLEGARRGYTRMAKHMAAVNAEGWVECIEHPAAGDPRLIDWDFFYVVTTPLETLSLKFVERLNLAITWPVLPEWGEYLLERAIERGLVSRLDILGPTYAHGLCVLRSESAWEELISAGVMSGKLSLN